MGDLRSLGPWGGSGGSNQWSFSVKGGIKQITIAHGDVVDSILFKGDDGNGVLKDSEKFGSSAGGSKTKIDIDWPKEYLTSISGTYANYFGHVVIKSLCFYTNRATYGPFGKNVGTSFSIPVEAGIAIVGFHGRHGDWLDAIGVYTKPREGEPHSLEGCISLGPWGGSGGNKWSVKGGIRQIVIVCGGAVDSILFKIINGGFQYSKKFGGSGGSTTHTVDIDWPKEYLTSMSGTYGSFNTSGPVVITSLCFNTNLTIHGPFGCDSGTSFSIPVEGGSIVGFHGHAGHLIDAIGVYVKPIGKECQKNEEGDLRSLGPWGGPGGSNQWSFSVKGGIKQITIVHGDVVDSILFKGDDGNGVLKDSEKFGGPGGSETNKIDIDWPLEYLTSISGTYVNCWGHVVINSLCFSTNRATYGPFGKNVGTSFSIPVEAGIAIVGFHGRHGDYLDAIGVYTKPREGEPHSLEGCISLGPWGASGGNKWSFSVNGGIKKIVIVSEKAVNSILFQIIDNGKEYKTKFGGSDGKKTDTFDIDWPKEYLTSISGTYGSFNTSGPVVITSLCFNTNLTIRGPFGCDTGTSFSIPVEGGSIVGFHGHAGHFIDAIGAHVRPIGKECQKNEEGQYHSLEK